MKAKLPGSRAGRNPAQRRRLASSLAEMAGLPGGNPPAGFALSQGNQSHTLAGDILTAAERLRRKDCTPMPWQKTGAAAPAE